MCTRLPLHFTLSTLLRRSLHKISILSSPRIVFQIPGQCFLTELVRSLRGRRENDRGRTTRQSIEVLV